MKRLKRLESIVRAELTENEAARKSDTALLMGCFERMGTTHQGRLRSLRQTEACGKWRALQGLAARCRQTLPS